HDRRASAPHTRVGGRRTGARPTGRASRGRPNNPHGPVGHVAPRAHGAAPLSGNELVWKTERSRVKILNSFKARWVVWVWRHTPNCADMSRLASLVFGTSSCPWARDLRCASLPDLCVVQTLLKAVEISPPCCAAP